MDEALARVPTALRALRAHSEVNNGQIAAAIGKDRNWVQERIAGDRACKVDDLARFAHAFDVPIDVLFRDRGEVLRYVLDHPSDLRISSIGWLTQAA